MYISLYVTLRRRAVTLPDIISIAFRATSRETYEKFDISGFSNCALADDEARYVT